MEQIYFGQRIAQLRRERGMTQEALAQRLGITNQAVSKWESDQCCPDIMQLPQLADLFGITLDALFGRAQPETPGVSPADLPWEDDNTLRAVCYLGRTLLDNQEIARRHADLKPVQLHFQGTVADVKSAFSVYCPEAAIGGNVIAGDGVTCGDVSGDVKAGDGVTCGDVNGSVCAGDSVTCNGIGTYAHAGDSIQCAGNIGGNASAGDGIRCGAIAGAAKAGGNIYTVSE